MPQPREPRRLPLEQPRPKFVGSNILPDSNIWCDKHLPAIVSALFDVGAFKPAISDYVVGEWLKNHEDTWVKGLEKTRRELAPELINSLNFVNAPRWRRFVRHFQETNKKDRPIAASAKAAGAHYIMSFNFKDFHPWEMHEQNLAVYPPDAILSECIYTYPYISRVFATISDLSPLNQSKIANVVNFWNIDKRMPMVANALAAHSGFAV